MSTFTPIPNGPLHASGPLDLNGNATTEAWLCRCGHSANKPFCDGAHKAAGFTDPGHASGSKDAVEGESCAIKVIPNGPLLCSGAVVVHDATGAVASSGPKAALCRCGSSANKPYCDGAHRSCGFQG